MRFRPRNVRSRLTLWYVLVLASLLALYAGVASLFLFLSLREDFDQNLLGDVETVEGMLAKEPNAGVSLHSRRPDAPEPRIGHFIEVWSPEGSLLYRSAALQDQTLGGPPGPDEGLHDAAPSTIRLPNGTRVRLASSVYHIEDQRVVLRVAYSEEGLWRELGEFGEVLALGTPGYRLSIENREDELGKLGAVFNDMLGRLQAAFDQLRRFTADASHELRTPLTAIRSVGEVALQDQRSPAEYRDVIGSMLEEVDRPHPASAGSYSSCPPRKGCQFGRRSFS